MSSRLEKIIPWWGNPLFWSEVGRQWSPSDLAHCDTTKGASHYVSRFQPKHWPHQVYPPKKDKVDGWPRDLDSKKTALVVCRLRSVWLSESKSQVFPIEKCWQSQTGGLSVSGDWWTLIFTENQGCSGRLARWRTAKDNKNINETGVSPLLSQRCSIFFVHTKRKITSKSELPFPLSLLSVGGSERHLVESGRTL